MTSLKISASQARKFLLAYQYLWPPRSIQGKKATLDFIHHVHCIQFDPLDMVGKNAELVLQSRVADFQPDFLRDLLYGERKLLDGYDKNMAIYPIEDWPFFSRRRQAAKNNLRSSEAVQAIIPQILETIEKQGPLSSLDLDFDQAVDWYWAPTRLARAALESLYLTGELIVHRKIHTRKVYDLTARHIPSEILHTPEPNPLETDYQDWYVLRRIGSIGLIWNRGAESWLGVPAKSAQRTAALKRLVKRGTVLEIEVEGVDVPLYMRAQDRQLLESVLLMGSGIEDEKMAFIAPLDNLLWDRRLLRDLFNFEYRWEVYKPKHQRDFGYYVIPVLYGERFVARFEPVREKKTRLLSIKNWWWEPDITPSPAMKSALEECLMHFIGYLNIQQISLDGYTIDPGKYHWLASQLIKV